MPGNCGLALSSCWCVHSRWGKGKLWEMFFYVFFTQPVSFLEFLTHVPKIYSTKPQWWWCTRAIKNTSMAHKPNQNVSDIIAHPSHEPSQFMANSPWNNKYDLDLEHSLSEQPLGDHCALCKFDQYFRRSSDSCELWASGQMNRYWMPG